MVTKKEGGREGDSKSASVWHCGDRGLFWSWTCCFSINNLFPFPLATALFIGDVVMNRRSGVKMFLSVITAPLVLAELIGFSIGRCHVNTPVFEYSPCKFDLPRLFKIKTRLRQYYWRFECSYLECAMGNWFRPTGQNLQRLAYSSRQCLSIKL